MGVHMKIPHKKSKRTKSRKPDPRVALFKAFYIDVNSDTFGNCRASAIKAGYSEAYADSITVLMPKWLDELLEDDAMMRADMLRRAQKNIKDVVDEKKPSDIESKKLWFRANEYISGTLGKNWYSTRTEVTGADGRRLFAGESRQSQKMPLTSLFKGVEKVETKQE